MDRPRRLALPLLGLLYLAAAAAVAASAEPAGSVLYAGPDARAITSAGEERLLARGDPVYAGDTLTTGETRMQVRFRDGGTVALRLHTRFRVDEYAYPGSADGTERGFFSLLLGAVRVLTGKIGLAHRDSYRLSTSVAVLGIRGTAFEARLCAETCSEAKGLYVRVLQGLIVLGNAAGEVEVEAGRSAYVADSQTLPRLDASESSQMDALPKPSDFIREQISPRHAPENVRPAQP